MGYTHYWSFKTAPRGRSAEIEATYQRAVKECNKIIRAYYRLNKGTSNSLSGYSAHTSNYGGIEVNGKGALSHESFTLREHYNQNETSSCKTARKPYDVVVTACLALLKYRLGELIDVSSDGTPEDWVQGVALAQRVLKLKGIKNPIRNYVRFISNINF